MDKTEVTKDVDNGLNTVKVASKSRIINAKEQQKKVRMSNSTLENRPSDMQAISTVQTMSSRMNAQEYHGGKHGQVFSQRNQTASGKLMILEGIDSTTQSQNSTNNYNDYSHVTSVTGRPSHSNTARISKGVLNGTSMVMSSNLPSHLIKQSGSKFKKVLEENVVRSNSKNQWPA